MSTWFCDYAWVGGEVATDVVIRTDGGRVTEVTTGVVGPPDGATHLRGLTLPAFVNGHSHVFHRALRGRTHAAPAAPSILTDPPAPSALAAPSAPAAPWAGHPPRARRSEHEQAVAARRPSAFAQHEHARGRNGSVDAGRAGGIGSFWTWREQMYRVAERLDPDSYHRLARGVYAEMVLAGYGAVGEFHYLHHAPGGRPYADPNAMGEALVAAAADAGIRLTLLDTCYLTAGVHGEPLDGVQQRFGDADAEAWATRVDALAASVAAASVAAEPVGTVTADAARTDAARTDAARTDAARTDAARTDAARTDAARTDPASADVGPGAVRRQRTVQVGAAVHSVRAVPADAIGVVGGWARRNDAPLHVHLSEQPRENEDCLAVHGCTPTALLDERGALGPRTTAVHATHLTDDDVARLARTGTRACVTRTTERDLADGTPRLGDLVAAGIGLTIGSDSNAVVDPFEETRGLELDERVRTLGRGHLPASALLHAATTEGYASLAWPLSAEVAVPGTTGPPRHPVPTPEVAASRGTSLPRHPAGAAEVTGADADPLPRHGGSGGIQVGGTADLVVLSLDSVRMAGWTRATLLDHAVFAATSADVTDTIVAGRHVVRDGVHTQVPDVARDLTTEIRALLGD